MDRRASFLGTALWASEVLCGLWLHTKNEAVWIDCGFVKLHWACWHESAC